MAKKKVKTVLHMGKDTEVLNKTIKRDPYLVGKERLASYHKKQLKTISNVNN